ncbi:MAG: ABC transporter ATP-binding protein [Methanomassiliicoccales archaeon]|nr:MAG: ABC transporter ATP-binding protein [Methanomassiliicoccales archaeon]
MDRVTLKNVSKSFDDLMAVRDLSLVVKDEEFVSLLGPSGCGKTTVLRLIAGLEQPTNGEIYEDGKLVSGPGSDRGMVFQEFALFPWRTVIKNVEFGLEIKGLSKHKRREKALKYIDLVNLEGFEDTYPHELSGGMKQRVGIARALANEPDVLLMDEPFGSLDAQTRNIMQKELLRIWEQTKTTIIFVTHSVDEAVYLSDRIIALTARPASVKKTIPVNLLRPRDRTSEEFAKIRHDVLQELGDEVTLALKRERAREA